MVHNKNNYSYNTTLILLMKLFKIIRAYMLSILTKLNINNRETKFVRFVSTFESDVSSMHANFKSNYFYSFFIREQSVWLMRRATTEIELSLKMNETKESSAISLGGSGSRWKRVGSREIRFLLAPSFTVTFAFRCWITVAKFYSNSSRQYGCNIVQRVHAFHFLLFNFLYFT